MFGKKGRQLYYIKTPKLNISKTKTLGFNMKLKLPELNTKRAIAIALLIGSLYTATYIYEQYRLTIEHRDNNNRMSIEAPGRK